MSRPRTGQAAPEGEPEAAQRRARSRPKVEKFYVTEVDEDGQATGESYAVPITDDPERFIMRNFEPGLRFKIERRKGGTFGKNNHVTFFDNPGPMPRTSEAGEGAFEEGDDLLTGDEPQQAMTPQGIARLVAQTVGAAFDERDRREREAQGQTSTIDLLREVEEMAERRAERERGVRESVLKEVRAMMSPQQQPPSPTESLNQAMSIVEKAMGISERFNPSPVETQGGVLGGIAAVARELGLKDLVKPMLGAAMMQARRQQGALAAQGMPQPAPDAKTQPEATGAPAQAATAAQAGAEPYMDTLRIIVRECAADAVLDKSLAAVGELLRVAPEYQQHVAMLAHASAQAVIDQLAQVPEFSMLPYVSHALEWVRDFQAALRGEGGEEGEVDDESEFAANNGHRQEVSYEQP